MPDRAETDAALYEVHGDFAEHLEKGSARVTVLSVITLAVSVVLLASYLSQIAYPLVTGQTSVTVNLVDPSLLAFEGVLVVLVLAWLYVGAVNFLWARRVAKRVREIKEREDDVLRRLK